VGACPWHHLCYSAQIKNAQGCSFSRVTTAAYAKSLTVSRLRGRVCGYEPAITGDAASDTLNQLALTNRLLLDIRDLLQDRTIIMSEVAHKNGVIEVRSASEPPEREEYVRPPEKDELVDEAVSVVQKHRKASTMLLQRELKCTYVKSSVLIDQLEAHGIISAPDPVTHRRKVV
jgi:DNA segregation ATPase FtsK/SpoIIIE-like protein